MGEAAMSGVVILGAARVNLDVPIILALGE